MVSRWNILKRMNNEKKLKPIAYGIYFGIVICFVIIRMLSAFNVFSGLGAWANIIFTIVVQILLLFGASVFLFSFISKNKVKDTLNFYGYRKISGKTVLLCLLMGICVFFLNVFVSSFFSSILELFGYRTGLSSLPKAYPNWLLVVNLILTAVLPAVCEETVHRGMLLNTKMGKNYKWTIVISSLMFGLLHMNIDQFFYATLIGLFLGYITFNTKTIYPAIIVHFVNNALSVLLTYSTVNGTGFSGIFAGINAILTGNILLGVVLVIILLLLLSYLLLHFTHTMFVVNAISQLQLNSDLLNKFIQRETFLSDLRKLQGESPSMQTKNNEIIIRSDDLINDLFEYKNTKGKGDTLSRIFMWLSIILMSAVTIFTFIWGVL